MPLQHTVVQHQLAGLRLRVVAPLAQEEADFAVGVREVSEQGVDAEDDAPSRSSLRASRSSRRAGLPSRSSGRRASLASPVEVPHVIAVLYALTGICSYVYIQAMESSFAIIAEPNRRAILGLLVSSERSVGEIERRLRMPQTSVSKHLRVLREAGFVESRVEAQRRVYRIRPEPLKELDAWLAPFRRLWTAHIDALERHLDRLAHGQAKRKGKNR